MRLVRLRLVTLAALPLATVAVLAPAASAGPTSAAQSAAAGQSAPAAQALLLAGPSVGQTTVGDDIRSADGSLAAAKTATFQVTYHGFSPAAKASFERAVNIWSTQVRSSVPITVDATFKALPSGVLGSAGPNFVFKNFAGAPLKDTWYVDALADKLSSRQQNRAADISANFSSAFPNWYFGTGRTPSGDYDFESVVLHELGHGLGFLGLSSVSGSQGTLKFNGTPAAYSRFTENATGKSLLTFADPSSALKGQLTSGKAFFDSPKVRRTNGGKTAKLFAPRTYQAGSSYSHLDDAAYPAGNKNSLMTHAIGSGEQIHSPGPITMAIFSTIGW